MLSLLMLLTFRTLLLSLVLSVMGAPIALDADVHTTTLSPRINHEGRGTWFYPGLGNCGDWSTSDDPIIAISTQRYGDGGNCNQWVQITNLNTGATAFGLVKDSCPSCDSGSLDMSPNVFEQLASLDEGVIPIQWHFMEKAWSP